MYANVFKGAPIGNKNAAGKHSSHAGMHSDAIPRTDAQQKRHEKDLDADNWHTKTMAAFRDKSNDALNFIRQDANDAIKANPDNPKAGQYMDEVHYASMELKKRQDHIKAPSKKDDSKPLRGSGWGPDLGIPQKR